ncbi:MAG TPA: sodium-dependent bicarbonate transport family permease [Beijerinckiaceae bacterium]|nr:sodium-dependent bicarbonate transport family permease [Beijerinckiaceae bacterium]
MLQLAAANLVTPMVLFFALGLVAALARSDLFVPEAIAKTLALYLMMAIGFKGGVEMAKNGLDQKVFLLLAAGVFLSALIPLIGYAALRATTALKSYDAAAIAAHYGSISIVTFVAATQTLSLLGLPYEGYLVAVAAVMEMPAIVTALLLARRAKPPDGAKREGLGPLLREVGLNGSVVMLSGAFLIGWATGPSGMEMISAFVIDPFRGILCLFLLDMGLAAGRGLRAGAGNLRLPVLAFGIYMPLISAGLAGTLALALGLSVGGTALLITLSASASYIAVPAAMRLALPEADPCNYLTLSLGVTFPFNLALGIPIYVGLAQRIGS